MKCKEITWSELADIYDAHHNGRKARALPMDTVFGWAERSGLFGLTEDGCLVWKEPKQANVKP